MTLQEIQSKINYYIQDSEYRDSLDLGLNIEKTLQKNPQIKTNNPKEYQSLMNMVLILYTLGIKFASKEIFESLIKDHLVKIIAITFKFKPEDSFIALIESKYSIYYEISRKNYIIQECLPLLKACQDTLGNQYLNLSSDKPKENPTIQNWLEYYDRNTKIGVKSNFERSKFLSNNSYVMNLSNQDKDILRNILYFYDYLHSDQLDYLDEEEKLFLQELKEEENNPNYDNEYSSYTNEEPIKSSTPDIATILEKIETREEENNLDKIEPPEETIIKEEPKSNQAIKKDSNSRILDLKNNISTNQEKQDLKIKPKARKPIVLSMPKKIIPGNTINLKNFNK